MIIIYAEIDKNGLEQLQLETIYTFMHYAQFLSLSAVYRSENKRVAAISAPNDKWYFISTIVIIFAQM